MREVGDLNRHRRRTHRRLQCRHRVPLLGPSFVRWVGAGRQSLRRPQPEPVAQRPRFAQHRHGYGQRADHVLREWRCRERLVFPRWSTTLPRIRPQSPCSGRDAHGCVRALAEAPRTRHCNRAAPDARTVPRGGQRRCGESHEMAPAKSGGDLGGGTAPCRAEPTFAITGLGLNRGGYREAVGPTDARRCTSDTSVSKRGSPRRGSRSGLLGIILASASRIPCSTA